MCVYCKDSSMGLTATGSFNCVTCASDLRHGVCLQNNKNFGICIQCAVGKLYNPRTCQCDDAVGYPMRALAYGDGSAITDKESCWALDDNTEYVKCVKAYTKQ